MRGLYRIGRVSVKVGHPQREVRPRPCYGRDEGPVERYEPVGSCPVIVARMWVVSSGTRSRGMNIYSWIYRGYINRCRCIHTTCNANQEVEPVETSPPPEAPQAACCWMDLSTKPSRPPHNHSSCTLDPNTPTLYVLNPSSG